MRLATQPLLIKVTNCGVFIPNSAFAPEVHAADARLPAHLCDRNVVFESSRIVATSDQDVIEYHVDVTEAEVRLMPVRTRPDKTSANGLRVITATVEDVIHAITPENLAIVDDCKPYTCYLQRAINTAYL